MAEQPRRAVWLTENGHAVDGTWRANPAGIFDMSLSQLVAALMTIVCGRGVAILDAAVAGRFGLPTGEMSKEYKNHGAAVELRTAGFEVKEINRWFHVKHRAIEGPGVWFCLAEFVDLDYAPIFDGSRKLVTAALAEWDRITGHVWRGGGGDAGNAILRRQTYKLGRKMVEPQWWANGPLDGPEGNPGELPFLRTSWRAAHSPAEVHGHDRVRAYLAAMTCVEVAGEALKHDGRKAFDKKRAGWWLVNRGPWEFGNVMPDPAGYHAVGTGGDDGPVWLSTPTVALLDELARDGFYSYEILDSWTAPAVPILKTYAAELRTAWDRTIEIADPAVRAVMRKAMKAVYRQSHGYWRSKQSSVQRRDWAAALVAMNRANLFRKLWKLWANGGDFQGPTPIFIDTDDVYYPEPLTPDGWTVHDDQADLDNVTKLGDWRRSKILRRNVSRETAVAC